MKALILIIAFLAFLGFLFYGCNAAVTADEARRNKGAQDWLEFSMQHHCRVSKQATFSDPNVTWQCEGFEVRR